MPGVAVTQPQEPRAHWSISLILVALVAVSVGMILLAPAPTRPDPQEQTFQNMDVFWMFQNIKVPLAVLAACAVVAALLSVLFHEYSTTAREDAHRRTVRDLQEHYQVTFETEVKPGCPVQEVLARADSDGRKVALRVVVADDRASAFVSNAPRDEFNPLA